jgi:hypothetical protein
MKHGASYLGFCVGGGRIWEKRSAKFMEEIKGREKRK